MSMPATRRRTPFRVDSAPWNFSKELHHLHTTGNMPRSDKKVTPCCRPSTPPELTRTTTMQPGQAWETYPGRRGLVFCHVSAIARGSQLPHAKRQDSRRLVICEMSRSGDLEQDKKLRTAWLASRDPAIRQAHVLCGSRQRPRPKVNDGRFRIGKAAGCGLFRQLYHKNQAVGHKRPRAKEPRTQDFRCSRA